MDFEQEEAGREVVELGDEVERGGEGEEVIGEVVEVVKVREKGDREEGLKKVEVEGGWWGGGLGGGEGR
ncbi:hypothetical protein, partial [Paenibacillus sp. Y412MC10]|uniref:hypothetical protein n=1 Tax=Geobacillus sp. (strain Y412MC10) TaxID=481743 RepID=UPI001642E1F8